MILRVLYQPSLILELLKVLGSLLIHFGVVLGGAYGEVDFGFDNMIEAHLIVASLDARLFTVEHVVRTALYFLHQVFWRTNTFKGFYYCHNIINIS